MRQIHYTNISYSIVSTTTGKHEMLISKQYYTILSYSFNINI
jgi:hypothetical protein